jgi:hypothetical protein
MTPKEKAQELILKYLRIENTNEWWSKVPAKEISLITIDEIIKSNPMIKIRVEKNDCSWIETQSNIEYWQDVKKEIEKL